jgi:DNA-binding transcriptional ArsR family regulator
MVQSQSALNLVYSALSDPTRRAMITRLARGPVSVSALAQPLNMSLTAAAKHVRLLERSGIVSTRKTGRVRTCHIDPKRLGLAQDWLAKQRAVWEARFDALDKVVLRLNQEEETNEP